DSREEDKDNESNSFDKSDGIDDDDDDDDDGSSNDHDDERTKSDRDEILDPNLTNDLSKKRKTRSCDTYSGP
nr:hypothetical protein [Tanacetum cinerariifolium]